MTLQQLKYFLEVCNTLHYTRASENLNISQPSLSYALNQLSDELGAPLFKKNGKKILLTEYGEVFQTYVESSLQILAQGEQQIKNMINPQIKNINLGYIYSVSFDVVPKLIDEFYISQGDRKINFSFQVNMTNSLIEELEKGTLDVILSPPPDVSYDFIDSIPILEQELFLLVYEGHTLANKPSVTADDFKNEKFVMINKKTNLYLQTEALFKKHNIFPETVFKVDECNSMAAFVGAQLGVAIMPQIPSLDNYKVIAIPFKDKKMSRTISLLWNKKNPKHEALKKFIDYFDASRKNIG
ncbi:DNA-binding transcriptional LysR family regulator [Acetoanaerobium pronyense]|uniref:DNA-binding transcriptional LysR family regulator n=1 Tax=Acetoanaerobium pronyense TaxID=1482736 RepID=A0ABS4KFF2_9FIRM|nr:LysR family transcriptional regulator [Acetoanaerobium pronyense]MBP2026507.1 DNA-binding transcriptional LysR family regulator [Acetoanaerobium pronyense]